VQRRWRRSTHLAVEFGTGIKFWREAAAALVTKKVMRLLNKRKEEELLRKNQKALLVHQKQQQKPQRPLLQHVIWIWMEQQPKLQQQLQNDNLHVSHQPLATECTGSCNNNIGDSCKWHRVQENLGKRPNNFLSSFVPEEFPRNSFRGSGGSKEQRKFFSSTSQLPRNSCFFFIKLEVRKSEEI